MRKEGASVELIDRYLHEVGQHLPGRMRADVQAELHSLLIDTLEERARAAGRRGLVTLASTALSVHVVGGTSTPDPGL